MSSSVKTAVGIDPKTTEVLQLDLSTFERKDLNSVNTVNVSGSRQGIGGVSIEINLVSRPRQS